MNKEKEVEKFLLYLSKIYEQNPSLPIKQATMYAALRDYGLSEKEKQDKSLLPYFKEWIKAYSNHPNLSAFVSPDQRRFLQFWNIHDPGDLHVKLYLTFPKNKIESCVKKIFDYIGNQNMPTLSKVADIVRSDSVVLRMGNLEDAKKVISFINHDLELRMCAKETNPFLMKVGKVGVGYDNLLSYNSTLALLLQQYFQDCRKKNTFYKVSSYDFQRYIMEYYRDVFTTTNKLEEFLSLGDAMQMRSRFSSDGEMLVNYEQVIRLILLSVNPKFGMEEYGEYFSNCKQSIADKNLENYYNHVLEEKRKPRKENREQQIALLHAYITLASQKYGEDLVCDYLTSYREGNLNAITREQNFRARFLQMLPVQDLIAITNGNFEEYVKNDLGFRKQSSKVDAKYLLTSLLATYGKYGYDQVVVATMQGLKGNYGYFTNGREEYRKNLSTLSKEEFKAYCIEILKTYTDKADITTIPEEIGTMIVSLVEQHENRKNR